jgi:ClpP class serine protease
MFPIKNAVPTRYPPVVTSALIAANCLVFFVQLGLSPGGTLIALAADEIVMCKYSVLGPVDPQLGQSPAASLLKVIEQKPVKEIDDQTLVLADVGRKTIP